VGGGRIARQQISYDQMVLVLQLGLSGSAG
jgi:hypothetical protein